MYPLGVVFSEFFLISFEVQLWPMGGWKNPKCIPIGFWGFERLGCIHPGSRHPTIQKMIWFLLDDDRSFAIKNGEARKPTGLKNGVFVYPLIFPDLGGVLTGENPWWLPTFEDVCTHEAFGVWRKRKFPLGIYQNLRLKEWTFFFSQSLKIGAWGVSLKIGKTCGFRRRSDWNQGQFSWIFMFLWEFSDF